MSYTVIFCNYPYTYGARRVFAPRTQSDRNRLINSTQITSIAVDTPFYEGQGKIYAQYSDELLNANYAVIRTAHELRYYYLGNAAIIQGQGGEADTIEFKLIEDVWATHFFKFEQSGERAAHITNADIINTNIPSLLFAPQLPRALVYASSPTAKTITPLFAKSVPWVVVMFAATPAGRIISIVQKFDSFDLAITAGVEIYSRAAQWNSNPDGGGAWENIAITKQFLFPAEMLGEAVNYTDQTPAAAIKTVTADGTIDDTQYPCYVLINTGALSYTTEKELPSSLTDTTPHKTTLITASREIPFINIGIAQTVQFRVAVSGYYANSLAVYLILNGERYDITNDFTVDRAANYKALERSYQGDGAFLADVSAAVGGVGGAIGGIASGNYFGAVQSVISTAGYFVNREAQLNTPATVQYSSNATACLFAFNGIATLDYGAPNNANDITRAIKYEGYATRARADIPDDITGYALRVLEAEVTGVDSEAAGKLIADLKNGVYFDSGTT